MGKKVNSESRLEWIDFLKGTGAMLVILSHEPISVKVYNLGFCFIMIPIFFFTSGYVTKFEYSNIGEFIYKRVFKLFVLYCIYGFLLPFSSISELKKYWHNPIGIIETLKKAAVSVISGKTFWFVACLIIVMSFFVLLQVASKNNIKCLFALSTVIAIFGFIVAKRGMFYWSADTALVCQWFFVVGFILKKLGWLNEIKGVQVKWLCLSLGYLIWVGVWAVLKEIDTISINVATNQWKTLYITIPAILLGNSALICLALIVKKIPLVNYVGKHSLLYFAFGSHGMSVANKLFALAASLTGISIFSNKYIVCPLVCVFGSLVMMIPCVFIDRFAPILNGQLQMPKLKKG